MKIHHQKHHQTYVTNFNNALEQLQSANDPQAIVALQSAINFNGGGHVNHSIFWKNLAPTSAKSPLRTLDELHVCEMPVWPCFPSAQERRRSLLKTKAVISDLTTTSKQPDSRMSFGSLEQLRCFVFTARARSFLYHQVRLLVGTLKAVGCAALTVQDGRSLGELVRKLGERVLPSIIPILAKGLEDEVPSTRQGVCMGLSEVMGSAGKHQLVAYMGDLIPTIRKAL